LPATSLSPAARICVDCGIRIRSGRPLVTRQGFDKEQLRLSTRKRIKWYSLFIPYAVLPVPLRSEALGVNKPYALWAIVLVTILASLSYEIARFRSPLSMDFDRPGNNLMLWSPWATHNPVTEAQLKPAVVRYLAAHLQPFERARFRQKYDPSGRMSDYQLGVLFVLDVNNHNLGEFHWYQLFTYMFLHDTSGIFAFALHLDGNMILLVILGSRVNAAIGNFATAVLYVVLGVCSAAVFLISGGADNHGPMLGASGAIMGMAGIYLILFPVQKIVCAVWIRIIPLVNFLILSKTSSSSAGNSSSPETSSR
jgi:membrane associated rhomboid family serine protease